jgi:Zn-dependent protease
MECFIIVLLMWVFSVCLHEYGHAKVAQMGGDYTVEEKGYLTMNPIYYANPFMSFVLPMIFLMMGCLALPGGAVYINRGLLKSKKWDTAVSLAGPAMNLFLAIIIALALRLFFIPQYPYHIVTYAMAFVVQLQISAILFNLIPIPPLDGFQAIGPWLAPETEAAMASMGRYGMIIIFLVFRMIPGVNVLFWTVVDHLTLLLGIDPGMAVRGMYAFRSWLG